MSDFKPAVDNLIRLEGGYAEPPAVEQPTKYGITQTDWNYWLSKETATLVVGWPIDVANITTAHAEDYMLNEWWNKAPFESINDQDLCTYIFQTCFLSGMDTGIKLVQQAAQLLGSANINVDGVLGTLTLYFV